MSNQRIHVFLIGLICLCFFLFVSEIRAEGVGMVTGSATGTYIKFGRDIAKAASTKGVEIIVKESQGSLDNIRRLRSKENAALAIVQSDLLGFLNRSNDPTTNSYSRNLKLVFPFYNEEVHLLAVKSIRRFEDLAGKRVIVGTEGSGNYLTSNNLLNMMNVKPSKRITDLPPAQAVRAVLTGQADAMFYVAGKPVTVFQNISRLLEDENPAYAELVEKIHFVPLENEKMLKEYVPSVIGLGDYKWVKETVPTIAVKAALVCYDFSKIDSEYYQTRCRQLAKIGEAVRQSFDELKSSGHPKWQEVNLDEETGIWEWDVCSRKDVKQEEDRKKEEFDKKILEFLKKTEL